MTKNYIYKYIHPICQGEEEWNYYKYFCSFDHKAWKGVSRHLHRLLSQKKTLFLFFQHLRFFLNNTISLL